MSGGFYRSAADYPRDQLIDTLISSLNGGWTARGEAVKATVKHLGFQNAGVAFKEAMRSAINGAIRRGVLEYDGDMIRKVPAAASDAASLALDAVLGRSPCGRTVGASDGVNW